jgi:hypothetical protein
MALELIRKIHETKMFNCESEILCIQSPVVRGVTNVIIFVVWRDVSSQA